MPQMPADCKDFNIKYCYQRKSVANLNDILKIPFELYQLIKYDGIREHRHYQAKCIKEKVKREKQETKIILDSYVQN